MRRLLEWDLLQDELAGAMGADHANHDMAVST
jgi:hypothetical protein